MEFLVLWLFVSIEKIAAFLSIGGSLFNWAIVGYIFTYLLAVLISKDSESLKLNNQKLSKYRKLAIVCMVVGAMLYSTSALLPSKKELAVIVGGGITYKVLTSDSAQEIGGKAVELLKKEIDKALSDDTVKSAAKEALIGEVKKQTGV